MHILHYPPGAARPRRIKIDPARAMALLKAEHAAMGLLTREHPQLDTRDAAITPRTFNATDNTIEAVIATDTPVSRGAFLEVLDPAGADLAALRGGSVLDAHRQDGIGAVLGSVDEAWRDGGQIVARLRFSTRPEVAALIDDIRAGIIRSVSIGYEVAEWREGTDAQGRRTRTAVKWSPREVSFVAVAADPHARTRSREPAPGSRAAINRSIRELARRAGVVPSLVDDLIDNGASIEDARGAIFDNMLTRSGGHPIIRATVGHDFTDPELQTRAIGDVLYARLSGTAPQGAARELAHRSLIDIMAHHLRVTGVPLRSESPAEVFAAAMSTRAAGLHTTSDFPTVLADTMNRRLGELFRAAASGASAIAAAGTARDFRPITEARMSSFPSLEPVGENGEIKWGTLSEEGERLAIASFARAIGVTFAVMVNDDLSAIDRSIRDTAFATAMLKARLIVAALAAKLSDDKPLFDAAHGNLAVAGGPPDEESLSEGRVAMGKQTPPGSTEPLGLSPAILMVPSELQTAAEKLVAAINPASSADVNVFAGKLQVAVEPRLVTPTEWYLFCAPGTYPVIRFLTLAGYEGPRFETSDEFTKLGTSYRVHWHVGAGPIDHRGAWKNPGLPSP